VPLKHRLEKECRDVPTPPFIEQEIDAHLRRWKPVPVVFTGQKGKRIRLEALFAPRQPGLGVMPSISSYGYQFKKACLSAGLVDLDGNAKFTPRSLRHFFASTALADPRGLALAGPPLGQDDGRHLRASAAECVGPLQAGPAARHASRVPGRNSSTTERDGLSAGTSVLFRGEVSPVQSAPYRLTTSSRRCRQRASLPSGAPFRGG
jgi:hypothetical protein